MRALGPFLMHLCWYIILSRVALPTIPTTKTIMEMIVLMYLKCALIEVFTVQLGGFFTAVALPEPDTTACVRWWMPGPVLGLTVL